jgi:hypothetical protein
LGLERLSAAVGDGRVLFRLFGERSSFLCGSLRAKLRRRENLMLMRNVLPLRHGWP